MSVTRLVGMASGMDTDSLIKQLMQAERVPVDRLKQKEQMLVWQSDAYRKWNTDLFTFRTNTLFDMKLDKSYNTFNVTSSNTNAISAVASPDAVAGNYTLKVNQLAESAKFTANNVTLNSSKSLGDTSQGTRMLAANTTVTIKAYNNPEDGTDFKSADLEIKTTDTITDVVNKINNLKDSSGQSLGLQAFYDKNLKQFLLKTKETGETTKIEFGANAEVLEKTLGMGTNAKVIGDNPFASITPGNALTLDSTNNKLDIILDEGISGGGAFGTLTLAEGQYNSQAELADAMNHAISQNSSLASRVKATVNDNGQIEFTSLTTGSLSKITVSENAALGFGAAVTKTATGTGLLSAAGQNASVTFNGTEVNSIKSNTVNLMGINFTLKQPTVDANGNPQETTITVSRDIDKAIENIKGFVNKYNELLEKLNKAISEPVYRSYKPLSDDEKSAMTEKQIEQWEEKAKSGMLRRDNILTDLVDKMRGFTTNPVSNGGEYNSLAAIGIKSKNYSDQGKLYIDENKLREALQNDPDAVKNLFTQQGEASQDKGIINRLYDEMSDSIKKLTEKAGTTGYTNYDQSLMGKLLNNTKSRIDTREDLLFRKEDQYYRKFAAMEKALSQYQSQSAWLVQQLGGGTQ